MPTVPYNPVVGGDPSAAPTPYRTDRGVSPETFGVNIGSAIQGLGSVIGRVGDTAADHVLRYQQMTNEADANNAIVKGDTDIGNAVNDLYTKEGPSAGAATP